MRNLDNIIFKLRIKDSSTTPHVAFWAPLKPMWQLDKSRQHQVHFYNDKISAAVKNFS